MSIKIRREDALKYHTDGEPGKIEVVPTKPLSTQQDLSLAYSPGVAEPCKEIKKNPDDVFKYTAKGNLVAVISNGTAVLGLGNLGAAASKPVMEGKGVLFKKFAGIDVFDIEIDETDPKKFVEIVASLEPTFGGINLEDIKAPESFYIEEELKKRMNIPVMHDDQHGTAIISGAALINALELAGKKIESVKFVVSGAGAAAIACTKLYLLLGARKKNIVMLDSNGVLTQDRTDLDVSAKFFATDTPLKTLDEVIKGADVFIGLSAGNILSAAMVKKMAKNPIVFAMANPDPEIPYEEAVNARKDVIMATGRSDHPNQVNNVLGFPFIFRGALDVRAREINDEMKLAAVKAIANLAKEQVPDVVSRAYDDKKMAFGRTYLIPKPLDPRLITTISPAVAKAAMDTGVARNKIEDWEAYKVALQRRIGIDQELISRVISMAQKHPMKVLFAEAENYKILKAAQLVYDDGIAEPVLLGNRKKIKALIKEYNLQVGDCTIIDPLEERETRRQYAKQFFEKRKRRGITEYEANSMMRSRNYFGLMMLENGEVDAFISGLTRDYPSVARPALQVIGVEAGLKRVAGMYIVSTKKGAYFFADTTVNTNPTVEELTDIIGLTARGVRFFDVEPRMAVLSYSNFGSATGDIPYKAKKARELAKQRYPELIIEGDIQANVALNTAIQQEMFPFSDLAKEPANTFIFPNLESGNIAYKLLQEMAGAETIGPVLMGMNKPVHILQMGSSVRDIVNITAIAVVDAWYHGHEKNLNG